MRRPALGIYWPVSEIVSTYEVARQFYLSLGFVEVHWFALDHHLMPAVRLRTRSVRWYLANSATFLPSFPRITQAGGL